MRTAQASRIAEDLALESVSATKSMVDEAEKLETGDLDAVQVWLKED